MEQKQLKHFTFYELYADILNSLNDADAGKFAKRICEYEFENAEPNTAMTDKEVFYWSNISDMLAEVKGIEMQGKIPKKYNLRTKHFTFYDTYFNAMKLLNDRQCGMFVKAVCEYMFGEYFGATFNLDSIVNGMPIIAGDEGSGGDTTPAGIKFNILDAIFKGADFLSGITTHDGLQIDARRLAAFADVFGDQLGINLGNVLSQLFGEADIVRLTADTALIGDTATADMDIYHKYMTIDEAIGEYKDFHKTTGNPSTTNYAPALDYEWVRDVDGIVKFNKKDNNFYDADGHLITMSKEELENMFGGGLEYTYTRVDGTTGSAVARIIGVEIDYSIVDRPQTITIVTDLVDADSLTGILELVRLTGTDIAIPGAIVYADVTVSSVRNIELIQDEDVLNAYDENKIYYFQDLLNPQFKAILTYGSGEKKEVMIDPVTLSSDFTGVNNRDKAKINRFGTFDMVYNAFGQTFVKTVVMADQFVPVDRKKIVLNVGQEYDLGTSAKNVAYTDAAGATKTTNISALDADYAILQDYDAMYSEKVYRNILGIQMLSGYKFSFSEAGEYDLDVSYGKGYIGKFKVIVKPELPGYAIDVAADGGVLSGVVTRSNQYGDGLNAAVKVEMSNGDNTYTALVLGTDYEIYVGDNKVEDFFLSSFLVRPFEFRIVMLKEGTYNVRVTLEAIDYDNGAVAVGDDVEVTVAAVEPQPEA